jgi:hypothetical protein
MEAAGGLSADEAYKKFVKKYQDNSTPTGTSSFTGSTYSDAVAYAKANGVPGAEASSIMTRSEWARRKSSYQSTGTGGAEVKNYSTYQEYLNDIVEYLISTHS